MYGKKYNNVIIILYREISQGSVQDFTWGWGISPQKIAFYQRRHFEHVLLPRGPPSVTDISHMEIYIYIYIYIYTLAEIVEPIGRDYWPRCARQLYYTLAKLY